MDLTGANYTGTQLEKFIKDRLIEKGYQFVPREKFTAAKILEQPIYTQQFHVGSSIYDTPMYCDFILYHPKKHIECLILDHVVAGAIYDFMGFLTTRDEALTLGGVHDAAPAGDAIKEFLTIRVVDQECEPQIFDWAGRCSCLNINDKERELHVPPPINGE